MPIKLRKITKLEDVKLAAFREEEDAPTAAPVQLDGDSSSVLKGLANAHASKGEWDHALSCCNRAVLSSPYDPTVHEMRAQVLNEVGSSFEAVQAASRCAEFAPDWGDAHLTLARCQRNLGEPELAAASMQRALALLPPQRRAELTPEVRELRALAAAAAAARAERQGRGARAQVGVFGGASAALVRLDGATRRHSEDGHETRYCVDDAAAPAGDAAQPPPEQQRWVGQAGLEAGGQRPAVEAGDGGAAAGPSAPRSKRAAAGVSGGCIGQAELAAQRRTDDAAAAEPGSSSGAEEQSGAGSSGDSDGDGDDDDNDGAGEEGSMGGGVDMTRRVFMPNSAADAADDIDAADWMHADDVMLQGY